MVIARVGHGRTGERRMRVALLKAAAPLDHVTDEGVGTVLVRPTTEKGTDGQLERLREGWAAAPRIGWVIEQVVEPFVGTAPTTGIRATTPTWVSEPYGHRDDAKAAAEALWPAIVRWEKAKHREQFHAKTTKKKKKGS